MAGRLRSCSPSEDAGAILPVEEDNVEGGHRAHPGEALPAPACSAELSRAAGLISSADALLVVAGAGMGVDSGLDTFRIAGSGVYTLDDYQDKCRHELFVKDPHAAWTFHGPVLARFREAAPHEGYVSLRRICRTVGTHFVCTSNVDGQFQKAGFPPSRVFNAHGSVHLWQCTSTRCTPEHGPWPAQEWVPGELPRCMFCKSVARPNVSLFDDGLEPYIDSFNGHSVLNEYRAFEVWLKQAKRRRLCILEIGCGSSEHSLRLVPKPHGRWACLSDEWGLAPLPGSLVRINPEPAPEEAHKDFAHIAAGAAAALRELAAALQCPEELPAVSPPRSSREGREAGARAAPGSKNTGGVGKRKARRHR